MTKETKLGNSAPKDSAVEDSKTITQNVFKETTTQNGLFCQFDELHGILFLDVKSNFTQDDFDVISGIIEPYYTKRGRLNGLIINSKKFPYWKGAHNRQEYLYFASNNHQKFKRVALNIGGFFVKIVVGFARNRVEPELKIMKYNQIEASQDWIME